MTPTATSNPVPIATVLVIIGAQKGGMWHWGGMHMIAVAEAA